MSDRPRAKIAQDTLDRTEEIVAATPGASLQSEFLKQKDLKPLERNATFPNHPPSPILVVNSDSYSLARQLIKDVPGAKGNVAVLNLASDAYPGLPKALIIFEI